MIPYINLHFFQLPTFGLMLWVAAVCACVVLHFNFKRHGLDADALTIVAAVTVAGIIGAKLWHVFEDPQALIHNPLGELFDRGGFAWFGGLLAGIAALMWQGKSSGVGPIGMLDLASPAAAVGYGVGRIGCHLSGDGDYGIPTNLPWAVSYPHGIDPTTDRVHPTPIYELIFSLLLALYLWVRGANRLSTGRVTGEYLLLSGLGRFLVEFIRRNPRIYWGMTNAQVASIASMVAGIVLILWSMRRTDSISKSNRQTRQKAATVA